MTGSCLSAVRDACRNGLLDWSPRLMLAMYECDIQASSECSLPGFQCGESCRGTTTGPYWAGRRLAMSIASRLGLDACWALGLECRPEMLEWTLK